MKGFIVLFFTAIFISNILYAQTVEKKPISGGSPYGFRSERASEFTKEQHAVMLKRVTRKADSLVAAGVIPAANPNAVVEYQFPLHSIIDSDGYFRTASLYDHDPEIGSYEDYMGGDRTYDRDGYNHGGTDYTLWPFCWHKMNNNEVQVIAAAPGYVVDRDDGNRDDRCDGLTSNHFDWNSVWLRHDDGTYTWYVHLRKNSVTTKSSRQRIEVGEVIGLVGSSGSSEEPHLHFETSTRIDDSGTGHGSFDPNVGTHNENPRNTWAPGVQLPYYDSAINKLMTHLPPGPVFNNCDPATINEKNEFDPGETVGIAAYYRDQLKDQVSVYTVYTPLNTVFETWTHTIPVDFPGPRILYNPWYEASYWYWEIELPENAHGGFWRVEVEYEGKKYEHNFQVTGDIGLPVFLSSFKLEQEDNNVLLTWNTGSEINNKGFIITRKTKEETQYTEIANCNENPELTGKGNYPGTSVYTYKDCNAQPGQYYQYQLYSVDYSGKVEKVASGEIQIDEASAADRSAIPPELQLYQNYPNPFNGITVIPYFLPDKMSVNICVYNLLGQKIVTLVNARENEGNHKITWNTTEAKITSGTFLVVLKTARATVSKRLVIIN